MKSKKTFTQLFIAAAAAGILTALDQWTKFLTVTLLKGKAPFVLIDGVLELRYLENHGAAFGILQGQQGLFFVLTGAAILFLCWAYGFRIPSGRAYLPVNLICVLILSGALGNLIDRLRLSYVVDFIYFKLIDFPIFNVADCYVSVSAVFLALLLLFPCRGLDWSEIL